ncbi:hypothetical protein ATC03_14140 [Agromyces aureus]|uniref:Uncharacterized protein n=1 Tax=Agromyces aureus TaxID=453304 RepID=A0A191WHA6_9MICO|nr:hypothetical protein ATC03_14140 [Agromyces aureus]
MYWAVATVVIAMLGASVPIMFNSEFYFVDDTQSGALGQWWEIGNRVLAGDWSIINPTVWQSGHYLAEGAWGVFSPMLWLIGLAMHAATDAVVYITIVKLCFFGIAAFGVWLLARTFGASPAWAAAIGVGASLSGFTLYIDAASWANGFMAWSLWALSWALVRRSVFEARSPLLAAAACISLIGVGYVHATLMLAAAIVATIIESLARRNRPEIVRSLLAAVVAGSFAVIVHLPSLLIAPNTGRSIGVANTGLLTVNLSGLAASAVPVGGPQMGFFGTNFPNAPLLYIAWFLPVLAFLEWRRLVGLLRQRLSLLLVLGVALVLVLLPSDFGPLRFPVRLMPYVTVTALVVVGVGLTLAARKPLSRGRLGVAVAVWVGSVYFAFTTSPDHWKWLVLVSVIALIGIFAVYWTCGGVRLVRGRNAAAAGPRPALGAVIVIGIGLVMLVPQHIVAPTSPLRDYGNPAEIAAYHEQFSSAQGDVLVLGAVDDGLDRPEYWSETLTGNMFYLNHASVQNAYSAVYYPPYQARVCMLYNGGTCAEAYDRVFEIEPETGRPFVDLFGVSTVQSIKSTIPEASWSNVPDGWHVTEDTALTRTIVRDVPISGAGGVAWTSDGTEVTVLAEDAMGVTLRVDAVPDGGGTVALSRLPWPGYTADGGTVIDDGPTGGLLLDVGLDSSAEGRTVVISYWSPGWMMQLIAGIAILLVLGGWVVVRRIRGRGRWSTWRSELRTVSERADQQTTSSPSAS